MSRLLLQWPPFLSQWVGSPRWSVRCVGSCWLVLYRRVHHWQREISTSAPTLGRRPRACRGAHPLSARPGRGNSTPQRRACFARATQAKGHRGRRGGQENGLDRAESKGGASPAPTDSWSVVTPTWSVILCRCCSLRPSPAVRRAVQRCFCLVLCVPLDCRSGPAALGLCVSIPVRVAASLPRPAATRTEDG